VFLAEPYVKASFVTTAVAGASVKPRTLMVTSLTTADCKVAVYADTGAASTDAYTVHLMAIGPVAY
jgi:hypothetical protein